MPIDDARRWIIVASISITGLELVFFLIAPALNYPLAYPKNLNILQTILPVFLGYLGAASHFIFRTPTPVVEAQNQYLGLLVKGPILVYGFAVAATLVAFGYSNRVGAQIGSGISADNLSTALSICLGVLAVTTSVVVSYLFVADRPKN